MRWNRSVYLSPSRFLLIFSDLPRRRDHPGVHAIARLVGVATFDFSANRFIANSALVPVSVITTRILNPLNVDSSRLNLPRTRQGMTSAVSILFNHITIDLEAAKEQVSRSAICCTIERNNYRTSRQFNCNVQGKGERTQGNHPKN